MNYNQMNISLATDFNNPKIDESTKYSFVESVTENLLMHITNIDNQENNHLDESINYSFL